MGILNPTGDTTAPINNLATADAYFAPLAGSSVAGGVTKLHRGYIRGLYPYEEQYTDQSGNPVPGTGFPNALSFHYNPTDINYGYDIDESAIDPSTYADTDSASIPNVVGGASLSFALRLDRTLEVAGGVPNAGEAARLGVLHDLRVFERMVGNLENGKLYSRPVTVAFTSLVGPYSDDLLQGANNQADVSKLGLNFRGYITAAQTQFTMFNYLMIPTRAVLDITIRRIFKPSTDGTFTDGSSATDTMTDEQRATQAANDLVYGKGVKTPATGTGRFYAGGEALAAGWAGDS